MKKGSLLITEKRESHAKKGYDYNHDSLHTPDQFIRAATVYLGLSEYAWPFDKASLKLSSHVENLTDAGSMIAAAIDLLQRYEVGKVYKSGTCMQPGTFKVIKIKSFKTHVAIYFIGLSGDFKPDKSSFMLGSNFDLYATPFNP